MKKTLTVLSFALIATFGFAQSRSNLMTAANNHAVVIEENASTLNSASDKGSMFTKANVLFTCDFSKRETDATANYKVGKIGAGVTIGGEAAPEHTQSAYHSTWHWIADTTSTTCASLKSGGNYPVTFNAPTRGFSSLNGFDSKTATQGLILMTMQDQISGWGGSGDEGAFDSYIVFPAINTTTAALVSVELYQYYRRFNRDQCWIDYSTDSITWKSMRFNTEPSSNQSTLGWKKIVLPEETAGKTKLYLRLRWCCSDNTGGAYGYYWFVDDFSVVAANDHDLKVSKMGYYDGFYAMMPKGYKTPVCWYASLINEGVQNETNVTGSIYAYMKGDAPSMIVSKNLGTIAGKQPTLTRSIIIDPRGWYDSTKLFHGFGWLADSSTTFKTGGRGYLPTSTVGTGFFYANVSTNYQTKIYGDTATFDTVAYQVNYDESYHNGRAAIARDNGMLRKFAYYTPGVVRMSGETPIVSTSYTETMWADQGYGLTNMYLTGEEVPAGWRILGVEIVPSTRQDMRQVGSKLEPVLFKDSVSEYTATGGARYYRLSVDHGGSTYTVTDADVNIPNYARFEYAKNGNYPTIFIPFPKQPLLEKNTKYSIGYQLAESANFSVAIASTYFYNSEDSTAVSYAEREDAKDFAKSIGVPNTQGTRVIDPFNNSIWSPSSYSEAPMIRMIVGPAFQTVNHTVSVTCGENGSVINNGTDAELCGLTDTLPENSTTTYLIMPNRGYDCDKLYIDDVETEYVTRTDPDDENSHYGIFAIENITANHTVRVTFKEQQGGEDPSGIDNVPGTSLKLQPNPATSVVSLTLKGVSGNVNMALIDMSGRVVNSSSFNAEDGAKINVSNLAKGAYFVRITNDKFSKVEKLIVR